MRVVSVAEMRALEAETFASGVSEAELQRRAGLAVADAITRLQPSGGSAVAFVGTGNNGRDAWIAAGRLQQMGWRATLYLAPRHAIADEELRAFVAEGGRLSRHPEGSPSQAVEATLEGAATAIDGLLGIGGRGEPQSPLREIIEALNRYRERNPSLLVVAVDAPSGMDADTGIGSAAAVVADATVVLGGAKQGLLTPAAAAHVGQLIFADIGVVDGPPGAPEVLRGDAVRGLVPRAPPDAHKGSFGRLLVVAGSERYLGAAYLTCAAAVRAGAGLVTLAAARWLRNVVASRLPEVTYLPLPDEGPAGAAEECARRVRAELPAYSALALGPGLSMDGGVGEFIEAVLRRRAELGTPAVVDADGLNVLAQRPDWPRWIGSPVVMTPHPGELRRLAPSEESVSELPWAVARRLSQAWGVTVVIKGAFSAIGSETRAWVHPRPNPGLATAGTGDVLTGLIAGLLARGLAPADAARLGVWAHGEAGWRATAGRTAGGSMASELLPEIPSALAQAVAEE